MALFLENQQQMQVEVVTLEEALVSLCEFTQSMSDCMISVLHEDYQLHVSANILSENEQKEAKVSLISKFIESVKSLIRKFLETLKRVWNAIIVTMIKILAHLLIVEKRWKSGGSLEESVLLEKELLEAECKKGIVKNYEKIRPFSRDNVPKLNDLITALDEVPVTSYAEKKKSVEDTVDDMGKKYAHLIADYDETKEIDGTVKFSLQLFARIIGDLKSDQDKYKQMLGSLVHRVGATEAEVDKVKADDPTAHHDIAAIHDKLNHIAYINSLMVKIVHLELRAIQDFMNGLKIRKA
jgi:hypothetical protein